MVSKLKKEGEIKTTTKGKNGRDKYENKILKN